MYPSSNIDNPFESFPFDQNPSPKHDDPSPFFNFPSPIFLDHNELPLNQILVSQNQPMVVHNCIAHDYQIETYLDKETTKGSNIDPSNLNENSFESTPNEALTLAKKRSLGPILQKGNWEEG
ncbi:transcription factor TCP12 [Abeliophyllum distichum]|uniref:Transcription factor TCP12 n=1 Tax=Abeliophyllum distichum TaxID=126358 RepID=A0ABD1U2B6_9LAMI